jgi:hypothetical protein
MRDEMQERGCIMSCKIATQLNSSGVNRVDLHPTQPEYLRRNRREASPMIRQPTESVAGVTESLSIQLHIQKRVQDLKEGSVTATGYLG